jgi:hypothetical protein
MDVDGDGGSGGGSAAGGGGGGGRGQEQQQQQQQVRGPFHAATGIPFWTVATLGLVGGGASGQRPGEHSQFVDKFKREHGEDHPAVAAETFRAAVDIAKSTHRFLVAYIHSPHHENTVRWKQLPGPRTLSLSRGAPPPRVIAALSEPCEEVMGLQRIGHIRLVVP